MATYKVIQDIEAEDKFLGPLTLKQFVFGAGGIFFGYLSVLMLANFPYALIITVPPTLLGLFLAIPWSKDQPTEVWVLAKLRFYVKPRKRIWDQTGMEELVTITAPKKEEKHLTDNLSQTEVKSRLRALADTIDSRGWVVKELNNGNIYQPAGNTDRLVGPDILPQEVPIIDTNSIPDVYAGESPASANFDRMIEQSTELRKAQNLEKMDRIRHGEPLENIVLPEIHFTPPAGENYQPPTIDEKSLTEELRNRRAPDGLATAHMRTINPIATAAPQNDFTQDDASSPTPGSAQDDAYMQNDYSTDTPQDQADSQDPSADYREYLPPTEDLAPQSPAILEYASNNDLNIATIARQAKKDMEDDANEVVVSLR